MICYKGGYLNDDIFEDLMVNQFLQLLSRSSKAHLLLDYDGTLAPFRKERNEAVPYPGVRDRLEAIRKQTNTRIVIISGRAIDDLLPLLGLNPHPEVWGCHGWERLDSSGKRFPVELPGKAEQGLSIANGWVNDQRLERFTEVKPASIAIHWRGLPANEVETLAERVKHGWGPLVRQYGLDLHPFNGGLELRCPGKDKGTVMDSLLADIDAAHPVAFLGDDLTDEDAFRAIKGKGLGVLVSERKRETEAVAHIVPPKELLDFFDNWLVNAPKKTNMQKGLS
jgi:trehalose-phosphatase